MDKKPNKKKSMLALIGIVILLALLVIITTTTGVNTYRALDESLQNMSVDEAE